MNMIMNCRYIIKVKDLVRFLYLLLGKYFISRASIEKPLWPKPFENEVKRHNMGQRPSKISY